MNELGIRHSFSEVNRASIVDRKASRRFIVFGIGAAALGLVSRTGPALADDSKPIANDRRVPPPDAAPQNAPGRPRINPGG